MSVSTTLGVAILAGGNSTRMNYPKVFLLNKGKTFLSSLVEGYKNVGVEKIVVVLNASLQTSTWKPLLDEVAYQNIHYVWNENVQAGRFLSVQLGCNLLRDVSYCFLQNCDTPYVNPSVLEALIEKRLKHGYVVPVCNGRGGHPVLISNSIAHAICAAASEEVLSTFLKQFPVALLQVESSSILTNINTPHDYQALTV